MHRKNLHIFSIGYEFSHDVAYKAHIFGLLYVWPYEWYMAINIIFLRYKSTEKWFWMKVYTFSIKDIRIVGMVFKFILSALGTTQNMSLSLKSQF